MKLVILLPGYVDSPDYLHLKIFEKRLEGLGYKAERLDPCNLWKTGDVENYNATNYLKTIKDCLDLYKDQKPEEVVLIGHSFGGAIAMIAGEKFTEVDKVIALCPMTTFENWGAKRWESDYRKSERDLPNDPTKFRSFDMPLTITDDTNKYSVEQAVKNLHKPLMIFIALNDDVIKPEDLEKLVESANKPYVVRQENMGHNFRFSETESNLVMDEIERFLIGVIDC